MNGWRKHPVIYEINTWVWLFELSKKQRERITLATVPAQEWDAIATYGFDAVWFMGVWERSPAGIAISMRNEGLLKDFRRALPDFAPQDNVGSPYCVRRYVVDQQLGGPEGLAKARKMLADRGMKLILDFVPNHVAPDHPWVTEHPDYFIQGSADDLARQPNDFIQAGGKVLACGRDPYFPAWPDVLQLNAFNSGLRKATAETVTSIADQCDGMRCDMAMLLINAIFERTWRDRAGAKPPTEYWPDLIKAVRKRHPQVLFMAEAYWDMEWELQQQGFDYCYDKRLYDRLEHNDAETVRLHLCADLGYQEKLVRFIENHDEPRAASTFHLEKIRAAALTAATLPGARLFHEGQFEGRRVRLPVFLRRRPDETPDQSLQEFYRNLLRLFRSTDLKEGEWKLCERTGWPDNNSYMSLVAWCWRKDNERHLIVVNLSDHRAQEQVRVPWGDLAGRSWRLTDALTGEVYERDGTLLQHSGLYVDLEAWRYHVLKF
ncbi:MAG: alpha-amylase [Nitrospira sp. CR1.3]|nr:alpha-amylase [Nitrospira sp. CR1.3]